MLIGNHVMDCHLTTSQEGLTVARMQTVLRKLTRWGRSSATIPLPHNPRMEPKTYTELLGSSRRLRA